MQGETVGTEIKDKDDGMSIFVETFISHHFGIEKQRNKSVFSTIPCKRFGRRGRNSW